jgi:hypothetical protein
MSKNRSSIYVLYSGAETRAMADRLVLAVKDSRDYKENKRRKILVVSADEAKEFAAKEKDFEKESLIVLQSAKDGAEYPSIVKTKFRVPNPAANYVSEISVRTVRPKAGEQSFNIILNAPDDERGGRLLEKLLSSTAVHFSKTDFTKRYASNKVVVHSNLQTGVSWGSTARRDGLETWDYIQTTNLADRPFFADTDPEVRHVYLVDRSRPVAGLPQAVVEFGVESRVRPNTLFAGKLVSGDKEVGLITAPNGLLVRGLTDRFSDFQALSTPGVTEDVLDFRAIGKQNSIVLLDFGSTPKSVAEAVRLHLGKRLRDTGVGVLDRGKTVTDLSNAIVNEQLLGAPSTKTRKLLRSDGVGLVWHLVITDASGSSSYVANSEKTGSYSAQPEAPERELFESKEAFQSRVQAYEAAVQRWRYTEPVNYRLTVVRKQRASFKIRLRFFDLTQAAGKVAWEDTAEVSVPSERITAEREERRSGHLNPPSGMQTPNGDTAVDDASLIEAGQVAADTAVAKLTARAWLNGDPMFVFAAGTVTTAAPVQPNEPSSAPEIPKITGSRKIVSIDGGVYTIGIGTAQGVMPGDKIIVNLGNNKTVTLKVISTALEARCKLANPADKAKAKAIRAGMTIQWFKK